MSGALGTVVLAGVASGVLSISGVVEVVPASISCSEVVTTAGVGGAEVPTSFSVSVSEDGVLVVAVEVSGLLVPTITGVGAGVASLLSVSFSGVVTKIGVVVVNEYVDIELVVMVKVLVIGTVLGVSLMVTTVLVTKMIQQVSLTFSLSSELHIPGHVVVV